MTSARKELLRVTGASAMQLLPGHGTHTLLRALLQGRVTSGAQTNAQEPCAEPMRLCLHMPWTGVYVRARASRVYVVHAACVCVCARARTHERPVCLRLATQMSRFYLSCLIAQSVTPAHHATSRHIVNQPQHSSTVSHPQHDILRLCACAGMGLHTLVHVYS